MSTNTFFHGCENVTFEINKTDSSQVCIKDGEGNKITIFFDSQGQMIELVNKILLSTSCMIDTNKNLPAVQEAMKKVSNKDRESFLNYFRGVIACYVPHDVWLKCIQLAIETISCVADWKKTYDVAAKACGIEPFQSIE